MFALSLIHICIGVSAKPFSSRAFLIADTLPSIISDGAIMSAPAFARLTAILESKMCIRDRYNGYLFLLKILQLRQCAYRLFHLQAAVLACDCSHTQQPVSYTHLKTPLCIINGFSENLREESGYLTKQHYINFIQEQANEMDILVHKMLDFSKLETDSAKLNIKSFNIKTCLLYTSTENISISSFGISVTHSKISIVN